MSVPVSPQNATGAVQHEGVQIASNTQTADQIRETLGIATPAEPDAPTESDTPEPAADAIESPTAEAQPAQADPAKPKQQEKKRQRYEELDKERHDLRRENERIKAEREREIGTLRQEFQRELAELRRMAQPKPEPPAQAHPQQQTDPEPDPADASKYPDGQFDRQYLKDQARWEARQEFTALQQRQREAYQQEQQARTQYERQQAERGRLQKLNSHMQTAFAADPSLESRLSNVSMTRPMWDVVLESQHPDQILAYMAEHPEKAEEISSLPPLHAFRALSRIEFELETAANLTGSAAPAKSKTSAHPPVSPVGGSHSAPAGGPPGPNATYEEHEAYWNRIENEQRYGARR